jgi:hypothetical protein
MKNQTQPQNGPAGPRSQFTQCDPLERRGRKSGRRPSRAFSHSPLASAQKNRHTVPSLFTPISLKTNNPCTKEVSHFFKQLDRAEATLPAARETKVADQEHTASTIVVHPRRPFAIVIAVLAFLRSGSAPQRRRDPALRRRGCCGGVCADGPRRRLRSGLPPLPRRF